MMLRVVNKRFFQIRAEWGYYRCFNHLYDIYTIYEMKHNVLHSFNNTVSQYDRVSEIIQRLFTNNKWTLAVR